MNYNSQVGATRGSALAGTIGRYRPQPARPSTAVPAARLAALGKASVKEAVDIARVSYQRFNWLRARPGVTRRYFAVHSVRKLHLGAGPVLLPGWLNADLRPRTPEHIFVDVTERFPFDDESVDYIFTEHLIGDLTYPQAGTMLAECHRVLKRGGRLRVATPSLARLAELYAPVRSAVHDQYVEWAIAEFVDWADAPLPGLVINNLFQEHPFVYDPATLRHVLARAGFADIEERPFGRSTDPQLDGIDSHGQVLGRPEISGFESLTLEAARR